MKEYYLRDFISESQRKEIEDIKNQVDDFDDFYIRYDKSGLMNDQQGFYYQLQNGDVVGSLVFCKSIDKYSLARIKYKIDLTIPVSAYYDFSETKILDTKISVIRLYDDIVFCRKMDSVEEMANVFIEHYCNYDIIDDVFKGDKKIVWSHGCGHNDLLYNRDAFQLRYSPFDKPTNYYSFPFVRLDNTKEQFVFQFDKKEFSQHKFVKGDALHFVFENNRHLEYQLKKAASNTSNSYYKQVSFSMLPQDIQVFASENLVAIRCDFQNGDAPIDLKRENDFASLTFKLYFQKYIKALAECGAQIDPAVFKNEYQDESTKENINETKESSCYVYLMKDESNGYYKIGISNKPEYRERTLQSEKPTIVLLCAKEYPTRIIAEAIEAALHKAYGEKRLRGEWFALDEKDILDVVKTLS
ncbi:MAG: GIY-YIG nuclease family protein [Bacteroidales bacterium]|nr:GIY-YIG nuclease family protein [Bacteroidales bacterium]